MWEKKQRNDQNLIYFSFLNGFAYQSGKKCNLKDNQKSKVIRMSVIDFFIVFTYMLDDE